MHSGNFPLREYPIMENRWNPQSAKLYMSWWIFATMLIVDMVWFIINNAQAPCLVLSTKTVTSKHLDLHENRSNLCQQYFWTVLQITSPVSPEQIKTLIFLTVHIRCSELSARQWHFSTWTMVVIMMKHARSVFYCPGIPMFASFSQPRSWLTATIFIPNILSWIIDRFRKTFSIYLEACLYRLKIWYMIKKTIYILLNNKLFLKCFKNDLFPIMQ